MPNGAPAAPATPTAVPATAAAVAQQLGVVDLLKRWALWQGLAIAAHGFAMARLPLPAWIQPWLGILWVMPIVAIIYQAWPLYAKWAARLIFGAWIISSLVLTFPLMQGEIDRTIATKDPHYAFPAWQRAAVDWWLKFAALVNPDMLLARGAMFDEFQEGQNEIGVQLKADLQNLKTKLKDKQISAEAYNAGVIAVAEKINSSSETAEEVRNTILGKHRHATGPFGVPFMIWTLALLGLTISAKGIPGNRWEQFVITAVGGVLTMMYLGAAIPEIKAVLADYSLPMVVGGTLLVLTISIIAYASFQGKSVKPLVWALILLPIVALIWFGAGRVMGLVPSPVAAQPVSGRMVAAAGTGVVQKVRLEFYNKRREPVHIYVLRPDGQKELRDVTQPDWGWRRNCTPYDRITVEDTAGRPLPLTEVSTGRVLDKVESPSRPETYNIY